MVKAAATLKAKYQAKKTAVTKPSVPAGGAAKGSPSDAKKAY